MTSIVYRIGACGTGIDNIAVNEPRCRVKRGDGLRIAARNCGYETTISFNTRKERTKVTRSRAYENSPIQPPADTLDEG